MCTEACKGRPERRVFPFKIPFNLYTHYVSVGLPGQAQVLGKPSLVLGMSEAIKATSDLDLLNS